MERGRDKHAPRIDEELDRATQALQSAEPTESRVEGFRKDEEPDLDPEEVAVDAGSPEEDEPGSSSGDGDGDGDGESGDGATDGGGAGPTG
jgi:hypothetical protein